MISATEAPPLTTPSARAIALEDRFGANNYKPLDVVISRASGSWMYDAEGNKYLDCLSAYGAVNQGHCHPRIVAALVEQASRVTLTSRAFRNEMLPRFVAEVAALTGMDAVLPMNTGAEAVETAIKAARRWGVTRKGIAADAPEIIAFTNNFHGRTTTITGFSSEESYKNGFGPFTPGFRLVEYGNIEALRAAINPNTCAVLIEPIQCEAGIIIPPAGFLRAVSALCRESNVLLLADEIQTGLGRTGRMFACEHEDVQPDAYILGKALSGGCYPVSAVAARRGVLDVFEPGTHGSTFGGNPLGCAVALAAIEVLRDEELPARAAKLGARFADAIGAIDSPSVKAVRGMGLMVGVELYSPARPVCEALMRRGMLCKETHTYVVRLSPPLVTSERDLDWAVEQLAEVLKRA